MISHLNPMISSNPFSSVSLGGLCGRRNDVEANSQSFSNGFQHQLLGVFQTTEKELRRLPPSEQTLGSAWRDTFRVSIMRVQSNVHLLDKKPTKVLIEKVNAGLGLSVNLPYLSRHCAKVIESLSTFLTTLETKVEGQDMQNFVIPQTLRDEVESALKVVKSVSTLVGNVDKARPSPLLPIILPLAVGLMTAAFPVMKGAKELVGKLAVEADSSAALSTPEPAVVKHLDAFDLTVLIGALMAALAGLGTGVYNLRHRAPSLREFTNALNGLESQLSGLEDSLSDVDKFVDYINTAPRNFYAMSSADIRKLETSDFPDGAFDEEDDAIAIAEDVAEPVAEEVIAEGVAANDMGANCMVANDMVANEVSVSEMSVNEMTVRIAPIPAPRTIRLTAL